MHGSVTNIKPVYWSVLLAFVLWYITFVVWPFNFWLMMSFNTTVLALISFRYGSPIFAGGEWNPKNILLGIVLAFVLYGIFWMGNRMLILVNDLLPSLLPNRPQNIQSVYANRGALSPVMVGVLLFFPIGFGEEVFWRGFIQRRLWSRWNGAAAFAVTTIIYAAVHLPTGNPVLILAAFVCSLFWGGIFLYTGSLVPLIVSHMLWDPFIFILFPIQ